MSDTDDKTASNDLSEEEVWLLRDIWKGVGSLVFERGNAITYLEKRGFIQEYKNIPDYYTMPSGYAAWEITEEGKRILREYEDVKQKPIVLDIPGTFTAFAPPASPAKTLQQIISDLKVKAYDHAHSAYHYEEYADSDIAEILEGIIADLERLEGAK